MASAFGALIDVAPSSTKVEESSSAVPTAPQKAVARTYHSVPHAPTAIELDSFEWGTPSANTGPGESGAATPSGYQTPVVNDLEMSRPASPLRDRDPTNGVDSLQSFSNPPINRFRVLAVSLICFSNGLSDSAPGALIPYMERYYNVGYAIVSLVFITNAVGFISAALFVDTLRAYLGRGTTLALSQALLVLGYTMIVVTPRFSVVVAGFFFLGFGMATYLALGNVFVANLANGTTLLGIVHGSYGIGGTLGPLISTALVTTGHQVWSRYYLLPLCLSLFNSAFVGWSFWNYESESSNNTLLDRFADSQPKPTPTAQLKAMLKSFKSRTVLLGALFIFSYQGAEVSISGWVISFLISNRHGNPAAVGYVTSGFWGGITLGRFLLSHTAHKVGEKIFVYGLVAGAAIFELLVWLVPNVIGDAVAVSIVGLVLGPVYPCATVIFSRNIPAKDQVTGFSVITAFGSSGGAVAPFTTGILAQAVGTWVMHPLAIGLFSVMMLCWFLLPTIRKRTE